MKSTLPPVFKGSEYLTTEMAATVLGIEPWRVIKFAEGKEYGIKPVMQPMGSGSRRLYSHQNLFDLGLALRLLEVGLRSKVIGKVLQQLRDHKTFELLPDLRRKHKGWLTIGIFRLPETGKLLNASREQTIHIFARKQLAQYLEREIDKDAIIVDLESFLRTQNAGLGRLVAQIFRKGK